MSEASGVPVIRKPWGEAIATFFMCLLVGPPVGGMISALTLALSLSPEWSGVPYTDVIGLAGQVFLGLSLGLFTFPFSYIFGGVQAAATGLSFAAYGWMRGRPPFWFALATAALVFAGATVMGVADDSEMFVPMILVHAVPALLCWLIIRTYWREKLG